MAALSVTVSAAVKVPGPVGLKAMVMLQDAPAARVAAHVLVCVYWLALVPVMEMLVTVRGPEPVFERVTGWAVLVLPTAVLPNPIDCAESEAEGAGARPVPLSGTVCGEP